MKLTLSLLAAMLLTGCVNAQKVKEEKVPAAVVASLHKMYPDVKDYDWMLEDGNYEAEYKVNGLEAAVVFDTHGNLLESEQEIAISELPAVCAEYVSKNYAGKKIREASQITDAKGVKSYEAELKGMDVIFDSAGNFISVEK